MFICFGYDLNMLDWLVTLDQRIFEFLNRAVAYYPAVWKSAAIYLVYLVPLILVWYWFARRRETALWAFLAGLFAWQGINKIIESLVHRTRPVSLVEINVPQKELLFHRPESSFPSDHTAFMMAIVVIFLIYGEKRLAILIGVLTFLTMLSRVVVADHWPGDVLAGMVSGLIAVGLLRVSRRPIDDYLIKPVVNVIRRTGL